MADKKGNLYLFEAIELRAEYDNRIALIEQLLTEQHHEHRFGRSENEQKEAVSEFDISEFEKRLKKLQSKRVKLNQAVQKANFKYEILIDSEKISLSEALEIRKNLLGEKQKAFNQVKEAAYKRIIHKEERDVVRTARYSFNESHKHYLSVLNRLKELVNKIHVKNHESVINYRDE